MGNEVLMIVDAVSREGHRQGNYFQAVEAALATATRKRHKGDIDARVAIHRDTGAYDTFRRWKSFSTKPTRSNSPIARSS